MPRWKKILYKIVPHLIATMGQGLMRLILFTCRIHVSGIDRLHVNAAKGGFILMFWHNRLAAATHILFKYAWKYPCAAVISNSRDGEILTTCLERSGHATAIRVPHHARHRAVKEMIQAINNGTIIMITPDGPRGPKYTVKPGAVFVAKATGSAIVPMNWTASRYWQAPGWDGMMIPKPFSTITVTFGDAVSVTPDQDLKSVSEHLQHALQGT